MNDLQGESRGAADEAEATPFYPAIIPREEGHPTSAHFQLVNTGDGRGRGLRATVAFRRGERVAQLSGVLLRQSSIDSIQLSPTLHMNDPWFCRFLLHSCDPNLAIDLPTMEARAVRDIQPGEYVTIDYAATEDVIAAQFPCQCGGAHCRGWMMGRREEPNEAGRAFLEGRGLK